MSYWKWDQSLKEVQDKLPKDQYVKVTYQETKDRLLVQLEVDGRGCAAAGSLSMLPGCCGAAISHNAFSYTRNRGYGTLMHNLRKAIAKESGFTIMLCTDKITNEPQRKFIAKSGFADLTTFTNRRTNNVVALSSIVL